MLINFLYYIQARTFIRYRTLIFFNAKFRPGCLFDTALLFETQEQSIQDKQCNDTDTVVRFTSIDNMNVSQVATQDNDEYCCLHFSSKSRARFKYNCTYRNDFCIGCMICKCCSHKIWFYETSGSIEQLVLANKCFFAFFRIKKCIFFQNRYILLKKLCVSCIQIDCLLF